MLNRKPPADAEGRVYKEVVATDGELTNLEFVLSDESVDRYGEVVVASGWKLTNFKRNPIALFGHDSKFPIGTWSKVRVEGKRLVGKLDFAAPGTSDRIDEIRRLAEQRILRAVSVGFRPLKMEPINPKADPDDWWEPQRYLESELLETSIVAVPANQNALQNDIARARSLGVSDATLSFVFGVPATTDDGTRRRGLPGVSASSPLIRTTRMTQTLAQRITDAQDALVADRDRLAELNAAEELDTDAIEELNARMDAQIRGIAAMKASEAKLASTAAPAGATLPATVPAQAKRRPLGMGAKELTGFDLLVRSAVVHGISLFGPEHKSIDQVLEERYPGHEATAVITKADQTVGTTTVAGWAAELVTETWAGFMDALTGVSIYPALRARGIGFSFEGNGTVNIPSRAAGGAGGGFFAEGTPMRVGRITTATAPMTARQMGVIIAFTRKLAQQSTPAIEGVLRQAILDDTAAIIDAALLDAAAADTLRPAGLLNGVAATAAGFPGGDPAAVMADFAALLAPFVAANAADGITVIMNPAQGLAMDFMLQTVPNDPFARVRSRFNFVESTHATANRLIALRSGDFATALGDAPQFDVSNSATVHMEDTTPLEIVSGVPTVADPIRSFYQTDSLGLRMVMDISWQMRRTGMIAWVDGTSY